MLVAAPMVLPACFLAAKIPTLKVSRTFVGKSVLIDPFMYDMQMKVFLEPFENLPGISILLNGLLNLRTGGNIHSIPSLPIALYCYAVSMLEEIDSFPSIANKLPADDRFVNLDCLNHLLMILYGFHQRHNLVSLFAGKLRTYHLYAFCLTGLKAAEVSWLAVYSAR